MQKNYASLIFGIIIGLILGLFIGKQLFESHYVKSNTPSIAQPSNNAQQENAESNNVFKNNTVIPAKVYEVLKYIQANHHAMPGYVGGSVFSNREKILPQVDSSGNSIQYQEWDVNPKIAGQNRGTERIVTGSDGRSWYTADHYQTFIEIK
ncbi:MAG: ribonuclease domain-containing protein [Ginsengibacter sp.]